MLHVQLGPPVHGQLGEPGRQYVWASALDDIASMRRKHERTGEALHTGRAGDLISHRR